MPLLSFETLPSTHEDHRPVQEGDLLVLCATEGPSFIKKGTSRFIKTGVKLQIPAKHTCAVAFRRKHGNGSVLTDLSVYTASMKLDNDGKPVEGSEGEGLTGEISVCVTAPSNVDLNIRFGEQFAVAYLSQSVKLDPPKPKTEEKKPVKKTEA